MDEEQITYRWERDRTDPIIAQIAEFASEHNGAGDGFVNYMYRRMPEGPARYTIIFENGSDCHLAFVEQFLGQLTLVEGWP